METDRQLYALLGAGAEFLALLTDGVRVRGSYRFEALEVKGLDRRTDGVLLPEAAEEPLWVIEFQAQRDEAIYHRMLIEMGLVGERHPGRTVRGLILFATATVDPATAPWHQEARREDAPLRVAYLDRLLERLEDRDPDHPLLAAFLPYRTAHRERLRQAGPAAYRRLRTAEMAEPAREALIAVFWSWTLLRFHEISYSEILRMFGNLPALEQTRAYQDILALGRQKGLQEGRQEGRQEGHQQGLHAEACTLVRRLARRRFGTLPAEVESRLVALPVERLEALAEALLDLATLADLEAWMVAVDTPAEPASRADSAPLHHRETP